MPREVIVFDTNALRSIGRTHAQTFLDAHRRMRLVCVASKFVAFELVSAAVGTDPRDAAFARGGIDALVQLTRRYDGRYSIPFTQSPLEQRVLPREQRRADDRTVRLLGSLLIAMASTNWLEPDAKILAAAGEVRDMVLERERKYGESLYEAGGMAVALMHEHANAPSSREAQRETMRYLRERGGAFTAEILAMFNAGIDEGSADEVITPEAEWMLANAATTVAFLHQQVMLSAGGEIDPRQPHHANSLWDARVCALVDERASLSRHSVYGGAPLYVVSSERQIINAAEQAGGRGRLRRLGEHCRVIALDDLARSKGWQ